MNINAPQIKICGLKDPELAYKASTMGANYIGLIFHEKSRRSVDITLAKKIAASVRAGGAQPVGIFVDHTADEISEVCNKTGITIAELHGGTAREQHHLLPKHIQKIYVLHTTETQKNLDFLDEQHDFILFDNAEGGSGEEIDTDLIKIKTNRFRTFIAGGVNKHNVGKILADCAPYGIALSSGVEDSEGNKTAELIEEFIATVEQQKPNTKYGNFGGIYMPELLMAPIHALASCFDRLQQDADFKIELQDLLSNYAGRPTPLTEVKNFQSANHGPRLFLKREDLLHTGAHKINNALGQCLLAKKMGKTRVIAETGAGQHGVATATACARLQLDCVVYMGQTDIRRQAPNVEKMKLLGATVISVDTGSKTLKEAVNAALRDYATSFQTTHYCLGSALGPYPYPQMVAYFQSVIGTETKKQCMEIIGRTPDLVIACVGGGSNAIGIFSAFLMDEVKLVGVEAGGKGIHTSQHAARFQGGRPGVLHGSLSYLLQDSNGQVLNTHSISAGMDYPMVGPEHADLHEKGRVHYTSVTDTEALAAFKLLSQSEGIIPALESSHALAYYSKEAQTMDLNSVVVINLSGRGDKDLPQLISGRLL